ncbi:MAG TPA: non-ribosomal peptide synthetase [Stellaceae bacterium]|nr:non-ribosomal peptide synthetase [Stellaceae bacterium]
MPQRVAEHAAGAPHAIALRAGSARALTYGELDRRADAVAGYLRSIGVGRETVVGIALERSPERIVASLAVWRAGGAFLPLDPSWPEARLRSLLDDAHALAVIAPTASVQRLASAARLPLALDGDSEAFAQFAAHAVREANRADDLAYVIYTSGSTGEAKGVEITHGNLAHLIDWHHRAFDMTAADTASHVAGLGFDAAIWEVWSCLAAGATLTLASDQVRVSAIQLRQWLCDERVSIGFVPTPLAELLMTMEWPSPSCLRFLLTGGDTLHVFPRPDLPFTVINNYGPTECAVVATSGAVPARGVDDALPTIGKPIAGTTIHLLDEQGAPVSPGWPGEICIGGPSVGRGYRNRPDLTAQRFVVDPFGTAPGARLYRTGDLGSTLPNGEICFRGRIDNQVKIRGYRIEPDGIAAVLARHPAVGSCAVVARTTTLGEKQLVAYVVAPAEPSVAADELRAFLAESLPEYMIPAAYVGIAALPLTGNGKLDKDALPEPSSDNSLERRMFRAPSTATEMRLAAIVGEVLGIDSIGADDNFFLIGGHSLLGTQVVIRARDAFGLDLTLWHLFEAQTVANLATTVETLLVAKVEAMSDEEAQRLLGH